MRRAAWLALAGFVLLAGGATWPVLAAPHRHIAWDLGDSLLAMWAITWDCKQFFAILTGDLTRIPHFFDANIFHPSPLALAHSEHFLAQALQGCPVYALTGNPILVYNLLFVSTFALSGFGTFLFVRDLTGSAWAGFVAGVLFAFAPYRLPQSSHLHVLSTQWMPLALYGLRRYFSHGRVRALLGAATAITLLILSCGYYLLYFTPFAAAYAFWEMWRTGRWRQGRVWAQGGLAAACVVCLTVPVLLPYLALESSGFERSREEVMLYSADVYSYATAFVDQPFWGTRLRAFPKAEGDLFPGIVPLALALVGLLLWRAPSQHRTSAAVSASPNDATAPDGGSGERSAHSSTLRRWLARLLTLAVWAHVAAAALVLVERRVVIDIAGIELSMRNLSQLLLRIVVLWGLLLVTSPRTRGAAATFLKERGFYLVALLAAFWLSLGPEPHVFGRPLELVSPYAWLLDHVPGYNGVRAPARFGMIVTLLLAVLGGYGAAVVVRWRGGRVALVALSAVFLVEGSKVPFMVDGAFLADGYHQPERRVHPPGSAPAVYRRLRDVPADAVIVELPIGEPTYDLRAVYYSTVHWRRIANGYSGFFPQRYPLLALSLSDVTRHSDLAWEALEGLDATHVVVHEGAFLDGGTSTTQALQARGAREIFRDGTDVLLVLR